MASLGELVGLVSAFCSARLNDSLLNPEITSANCQTTEGGYANITHLTLTFAKPLVQSSCGSKVLAPTDHGQDSLLGYLSKHRLWRGNQPATSKKLLLGHVQLSNGCRPLFSFSSVAHCHSLSSDNDGLTFNFLWPRTLFSSVSKSGLKALESEEERERERSKRELVWSAH